MPRNRRPCALSKSEHRGEADRARAILLTLEGRQAEEIAAVLGVHISTVRNWRGYFAHGGVAGLRRRPRPGQQAKIGPHAGAIAAAILTEDVRHDGGWTLPRLCAEIARRGGPAISPRWLSHQLRQRVCLPAAAPQLKGRQDAAAVEASRQHLADLKTQAAAGASIWCSPTNPRRSRIPIWRAAGPGAAPSCASKRRFRRKSGRCSAPYPVHRHLLVHTSATGAPPTSFPAHQLGAAYGTTQRTGPLVAVPTGPFTAGS